MSPAVTFHSHLLSKRIESIFISDARKAILSGSEVTWRFWYQGGGVLILNPFPPGGGENQNPPSEPLPREGGFWGPLAPPPFSGFPPVVAKYGFQNHEEKTIRTPFLTKILFWIIWLYSLQLHDWFNIPDGLRHIPATWTICSIASRYIANLTTLNPYTITIMDTESIKGSKIIQNEISNRT